MSSMTGTTYERHDRISRRAAELHNTTTAGLVAAGYGPIPEDLAGAIWDGARLVAEAEQEVES